MNNYSRKLHSFKGGLFAAGSLNTGIKECFSLKDLSNEHSTVDKISILTYQIRSRGVLGVKYINLEHGTWKKKEKKRKSNCYSLMLENISKHLVRLEIKHRYIVQYVLEYFYISQRWACNVGSTGARSWRMDSVDAAKRQNCPRAKDQSARQSKFPAIASNS